MGRYFLIFAIVFSCLHGSQANLSAPGETKQFEVSKKEDLLRAEMLDGLMITSKGEVKLGYQVAKAPDPAKGQTIDEPSFWTGCEEGGSFWVGTPTGKIYKVSPTGIGEPFDTKDLIVTSIVAVGKDIFAATVPSGTIYKLSGGSWKEFVKTDKKYIWQLFPVKDGLLAACGTPAKLVKISLDGKVNTLFSVKAENVLSIASQGSDILIGTSKPGYLIRVKEGKPDYTGQVLYDFQEQEVKAIRVQDKNIYVAINNASNFSPYSFLADVRSALASHRQIEPKRPQLLSSASSTVSCSIWKITHSKTEPIVEFSPAYVSDIVWDQDGLLVGLANSGRVFKVFDDGNYELSYSFKENQVLGFVTSSSKLKAVCLGDRAALGITTGERATLGTFVSQVFDSKFQSDWGTIMCKYTGKAVKATVRWGNVLKPEDGWFDWTAPIESFPSKLPVPRTRYIQVKLTVQDPETAINSFALSYKNENQRPKITDLKVTTAVTVPIGPYTSGSGTKALPPHTTTKTVTWAAHDSDGDILSYRLFYRRANSQEKIPVFNVPTVLNSIQWNTDTIPDGKYKLTLVASDERSNNDKDVLTQEAESDEFVIDNTKPQITYTIDDKTYKISAVATDKMTNIIRIEYQINSGDFKTVQPKDGIFDSTTEQFDILPWSGLKGEFTVTIKAYDAEHNFCVTSAQFSAK